MEGAQAGLSWLTILKRREGYREAFCNFDVQQVAQLTEKDIQRLMQDAKIIRNQAKIRSAIGNAQAFMQIQKEFGSFDVYAWSFVGGKPLINHPQKHSLILVTTKESDAFSQDLKKRGFQFVGSTIMYAYMQAVGMVNDHWVSCAYKLDPKSRGHSADFNGPLS